MSTYLMSDIHGAYNQFKRMLNIIKFSDSTDQLYIIGDAVDRGPYSFAVLDHIMKHNNMELIKGNHELFLQMYLEGDMQQSSYAAMGGERVIFELESMSKSRASRYLNYISQLPLFKTVKCNGKTYFLTHSGYLDKNESLIKNADNHLIDIEKMVNRWVQMGEYHYLISNDLHHLSDEIQFDKRLIVGHWPTQYITGESGIYTCDQYIDIDNGVSKIDNAQLSCLRLDDMMEFYV